MFLVSSNIFQPPGHRKVIKVLFHYKGTMTECYFHVLGIKWQILTPRSSEGCDVVCLGKRIRKISAMPASIPFPIPHLPTTTILPDFIIFIGLDSTQWVELTLRAPAIYQTREVLLPKPTLVNILQKACATLVDNSDISPNTVTNFCFLKICSTTL